MNELKDKINEYITSKKGFFTEDERKKTQNNSATYPKSFMEIAKSALGGFFEIKGKDSEGEDKVLHVHPTCVEFYYHEEGSEAEDIISDPIVYHRNTEKKKLPIFGVGILHNHVSGIDVTFEHEYQGRIVRASMLIREFTICNSDNTPVLFTEGNNVHNFYRKKNNIEDRSTYLYAALFSQFNIFDGFHIVWRQGSEIPQEDIEDNTRQNVPLYAGKDKMTEVKAREMHIDKGEFFSVFKISGKSYVQDPKRWQFRRIKK